LGCVFLLPKMIVRGGEDADDGQEKHDQGRLEADVPPTASRRRPVDGGVPRGSLYQGVLGEESNVPSTLATAIVNP
jgi:hypothetical protein